MKNMFEFKDIAKYYIGQQVQHADGETASLYGVDLEEYHLIHDGTGSFGTSKIATSDIKPILRPITALTDDEKVAWYEMAYPNNRHTDSPAKIRVVTSWVKFDTEFSAKSFHYLLSIGIDLFGLLESQQAIN